MRKTLIVNLDDCIGCHTCAVICKQENNVDLGVFWNKVNTMGPYGKYPDLKMYYLPIMCQHCEDPACVNVCPTGASYKREDGIVLVDHNKCVGCQYCIMACPYGVRTYTEKGVMEKCTLCAQRVDGNEQPACVGVCPGQARIFGDIDDPTSDVAKLAKKSAQNLHKLVDVGNKPGVSYLLSTVEWRD